MLYILMLTNLLMFIADDELVNFRDSSQSSYNVYISQLELPGFSMFLNFDPDDQSSYILLRIRIHEVVIIYVADNRLVASFQVVVYLIVPVSL